MRLRDVAQTFKAAAEVARVGEQLLVSLDRSRNHAGSILLGIGLGVGLGALLFSESARTRVRTILAPPEHAHPSDGEAFEAAAPH
jgi:hypothetical protein